MPRVTATERDATRRRLLEAGKAEFASRGLAGARFDEISVAAGHAKGTIYNYFESKEALFFSIAEEWCALLTAAVEFDDPRPARQQLLAIAELDIEIARKDPDLALVVVQHMPALSVSHAEAVDAAIGDGLVMLADVFARGLESAEFSSLHSPQTLARLFLAILSSIELEALDPGSAVHLDHVAQLVDTHFLKGLIS